MTATNSNQSVVPLSTLEVVKIGDGANATTTITPVSIGQTTTAKVHGVTRTRDTAPTVTNEQLASVPAHVDAEEVFIDDVGHIRRGG